MLGSIISGIGSVVGGLFGANSASKDRKSQKEYAQNSVQWRAADAKKAGLHPLATMGYSGSSYSPVGDGGAGAAISQAGAQIGQHMNAGPKNQLATQLAQSSMGVDSANIELLKAQKLQILDNIRKGLVGTKGSTTQLPSAEQITGPLGGWKTGASTKTQDIEDHYGGAAGEIYGILRLLTDTVSHSTPNIRMQVSPKGKKPHVSRRQGG